MHLLKTALICAMPLLLAVAGRADDTTNPLTSMPLDTIHTQRTDVPSGLVPLGPGAEGGQFTTGQEGGTVPYLNNPACSGSMGPTLSVTNELLVWKLGNGVDQPLVRNALSGAPRMSTGDMGFGYQPGMKTDVQYMSPEEDSAFEVQYFGIYEWTDNKEIDSAPHALGVPGDVRLAGTFGNPYTGTPTSGTQDYSFANAMTFRNQATFNSLEANLVWGGQKSNTGITFGPRYLGLYESFKIQSYSTFPNVGQVGAPSSVYEIDTRNDLLGASIGFFYRGKYNCWEDYVFVKGGVYGNSARQSTFVTDAASTLVLRNNAPTASITASSLEAGLSVRRWLNKNWLVHLGSEAMWVQNVARASDQLDFTTNSVSGSVLQFRQGALMYGGDFGVEARY
jgi:hypothetical protein